MRFFLSSNRTFFQEGDPHIKKLKKLGFLFKEIYRNDAPTEFKLISNVASANRNTLKELTDELDKLEILYVFDGNNIIELA